MEHPGPIVMFPRGNRFNDVAAGQDVDSCFVYVAELDNGFVKFGISRSPRNRLSSVNSTVKRLFDSRVARHYLSADLGWRECFELERVVLRMAVQAGAQPTAMGECFSALTFEQAVAFVERAALVG